MFTNYRIFKIFGYICTQNAQCWERITKNYMAKKNEIIVKDVNPELKGNIRDYATINELICLSNMENIRSSFARLLPKRRKNAVLIRSALWDALLAKNDGMPQGERLVKLNQIAIQQMQVLEGNSGRNLLKW